MLVILFFLPWRKNKLFCDDKGLITIIIQTQQIETILSPCSMFSKSNIELQIGDILTALNTNISIFYVKGHQEKHTTLAKLPWSVQLNQQCDELATVNPNIIIKQSTVLVLPVSNIMLQIGNFSITHHMADQIFTLYCKSFRKISQHTS